MTENDKEKTDPMDSIIASKQKPRIGIIKAVKTPLSFFVLMSLILEAILAVAVRLSDGFDRTLLISGMIALGFLLVVVVAIITCLNPWALLGMLGESKQSSKILEDPVILKKVGDYYIHIKNWEKAKECSEIALKMNPNNIIALYNLGRAFYLRGDYDKDIAMQRKVLKINDKDMYAYAELGHAYWELPDYDEAIKNFKKAIELGMNDAETWGYLGKLYKLKGDEEEARKCYDKADEFL